MPLLAGGLFVIDPPQEVVTPPTVAYLETVGKPVFTWIDPDGREWPLSNTREDLGWFTLWPSGWGAAPIEITTDQLAQGGEAVRAVASRPSTLQWPLEIFGRTHDEFVSRYRRISRAFAMTTRRMRPGVLRVQRPDGSARQIEAWYQDGLGAEGEQNHLFARPVISLLCPEGKWRAAVPVVAERTFSSGGGGEGGGGGGGEEGNFFDPYLSIANSQIVGTPGSESPGDSGGGDEDDPNSLTEVTNPGDEDAWPVWTVTGPMTRLRAWNTTLDTRFMLTYTLGEQQTITITTGSATVRGPGDANLSRFIDWFNPAGAELWPLTDGVNKIGLEVDGAGPSTAVRMAFTPRYDGA